MNNESSKLVLQLIEKIDTELGILCNPNTFQHNRIKHNKLKNDIYFWTIKTFDDGGNQMEITSCDTLSECVRRDRKLEVISHNLNQCVVYAEKRCLL